MSKPNWEIYHRRSQGDPGVRGMDRTLRGSPGTRTSAPDVRHRAARFVASAALSGIDASILLDMLGLTAEEGKTCA